MHEEDGCQKQMYFLGSDAGLTLPSKKGLSSRDRGLMGH